MTIYGTVTNVRTSLSHCADQTLGRWDAGQMGQPCVTIPTLLLPDSLCTTTKACIVNSIMYLFIHSHYAFIRSFVYVIYAQGTQDCQERPKLNDVLSSSFLTVLCALSIYFLRSVKISTCLIGRSFQTNSSHGFGWPIFSQRSKSQHHIPKPEKRTDRGLQSTRLTTNTYLCYNC